MNKIALIISILGALALNGCALNDKQTSAIAATDKALQDQLPKNSLPYLQAAETIYAAYQGFTIPQSSIQTGNPKVDAVLQKATTEATVVPGDVATIKNLVAAFSTTKVPVTF